MTPARSPGSATFRSVMSPTHTNIRLGAGHRARRLESWKNPWSPGIPAVERHRPARSPASRMSPLHASAAHPLPAPEARTSARWFADCHTSPRLCYEPPADPCPLSSGPVRRRRTLAHGAPR